MRKEGIEILCIGTELLLGNIINSNAKWLAEELALLGLNHYRQSVIGDNYERLKKIIVEASTRSDILITTGGIGPTLDDITTATIASAFNAELIQNEAIVNDIKYKLKDNPQLSNNNFKQALLPKNATIINNPLGTAPGMIWEPKHSFTIITLPGVPSEMKAMWKETVQNWLKNKYQTQFTLINKIMKFTGISESALVTKIPDLLKNQNPTIAPYASLGEVKLRITAKAKNTLEASQIIAPFEKELRARLGLYYFGQQEETLPWIALELLKARKETISLAESCTGGKLAASLTAIPGSSDVFLGGVVAYQNSIKNKLLGVSNELLETYGAVS